jgi:hypothetical protein
MGSCEAVSERGSFWLDQTRHLVVSKQISASWSELLWEGGLRHLFVCKETGSVVLCDA